MAAIALTFATAACTQHRDGETRTLRLSTYSEPPGFDPLVSDNAYLQDFAPILHGFLLRTEADGGFTPDLVARVPTLRNGDLRADGRSIHYRLRRGVRWQDGAPFDARDVVFSFAAARNPRNNVPDRSGFDDVASVVALGPYDVEVRLRRPFSPALATFFSDGANDPYPILPAHLLASLPQLNDAAYNGRPIGLGPYRLERWERGSRFVFVADPHYRFGAARIPRIEVRVVPDNNTQLALWQARAFDFLLVRGFSASRAMLDGARRVAGVHEYLSDHYQFNYVMFQTARGPLRERAVREAVVRGVDGERIQQIVRGELQRAGEGDRLPGQFAFDPSIRQATYDPQEAMHLLDSAGWRRVSGGIRRKNGVELALEIVGPTGGSSAERFNVQLQAALARLGIRTTVKTYQYALLFAPAQNGGIYANGKFDLAFYGWQPGEDADHSYLFRCDTRPPAGENYGRICDPAIDRAAERELTATDPREQDRSDREILRKLDVQSDQLWLGFDREALFATERLHGVQPSVLGHHFWNVERWYFADR